jgi:hypothetical protein
MNIFFYCMCSISNYHEVWCTWHVLKSELNLQLFILFPLGQMLTLVEYLLLLYGAFLLTPVCYGFFLNKEYDPSECFVKHNQR